MSFIIVDVASDGPIPAEFSMVCFGAVLFDEPLDKSFYGQTRPNSDRFVPQALAVSGFSREQHMVFDDPKMVMESFAAWLDPHAKGRAVFVSDNVAFDWQCINYYFHRFLGRNPSGFPGAGSVTFMPASSKTRPRRLSGKSIASPNTRTIPWTTPEAMPKR
ncbi:MAG: exonuclease [Pedosphaera sp.]|nr:exonuclease [Pedosphaera sp.]